MDQPEAGFLEFQLLLGDRRLRGTLVDDCDSRGVAFFFALLVQN